MASRLEVIVGPMFSGKSEELIRILRREVYAKRQVLVIKPSLDNRTGTTEIAAREIKNGRSVIASRFPAHSVISLKDFRVLVAERYFHVLAIEEGQFFRPWIVKAVSELLRSRAHDDLRIIVVGLDLDANLQRFGSMPALLTMADDVQKLYAVCFKCGAPARYTERLGGSGEQIQVGDIGLYEARCRKCHSKASLQLG